MRAGRARTPTGKPLREILVERGVLAPEQLDRALAEQRRCRRPLGEVIVRLGLAGGPTIAQALATQHGRVFRSEYGFATGFDAEIAAPAIGEPPITIQLGEELLAGRPPPAEQRRDADVTECEERLAAAEAHLDRLAEQLAAAAHRMVAAERDRDAALAEAAAQAVRIEQLATELAGARNAAETPRGHPFE